MVAPTSLASVLSATRIRSIMQRGGSNTAIIDYTGDDSNLYVEQTGASNIVTMDLTGSSQTVMIVQNLRLRREPVWRSVLTISGCFCSVCGEGAPVTANSTSLRRIPRRGLLFVVQASTSSRIGTVENPFTVGGGEQNIELAFVGENNSLDGQLVGGGLEFAARLEGDLNALNVDTNFNGLVASFLGLDVEGALNGFVRSRRGRRHCGPQDPRPGRRVLELAELDLRYEITGAGNVLTFSQRMVPAVVGCWTVSEMTIWTP